MKIKEFLEKESIPNMVLTKLKANSRTKNSIKMI